MVEDLVVKENLTEEMIEVGETLIDLLDAEQRIEVTAAFWLFLLEDSNWQLVLASPQVQIWGPRQTYKLILSALAELPKRHSVLELNDIRVVTSDDLLVHNFKVALGKVDGTHGVWFKKNAVGGQYIEDAYIYRLC